jgi:gamma-glutamylcyclotransferase (GGCT)/AIG2-like uncharacterized protein YtfP
MKTPTPIQTFVQCKLDDTLNTGDVPALLDSKWQPVFLYGTLKHGYMRHRHLIGSYFLGNAWSRNTGFTMYIRSKIAYPYPVIFPAICEKAGAVFGEMYLVPPRTLITLDYIEGNGIQFTRTLKTFDLATRDNKQRTMAAWIYLSQREIWDDLINNKGVTQASTFTRKDKAHVEHFYMYTKEQDKNATLRNL